MRRVVWAAQAVVTMAVYFMAMVTILILGYIVGGVVLFWMR